MNEVYEFLKKCGTYYLATVEDGQPRVRPFGTIDLFDGALTIQTGRRKAFYQQLKANPALEICACKADGSWIRVEASAVEDARFEAEKSMLDAYPMLQGMYQPGDGNTCVFALENGTATISSFTEAPRTLTW